MPEKANPPPAASKKAIEETRGQPVGADLQNRKSIVIGRGLDCDVVVKDVKASRRHCQLTRQGSVFVLEDLGSKNGTFVNGERITTSINLKPNQSFKIGDTVFYIAS